MEQNNDMSHTINGVQTNLLVFIRDLIDDDEDIDTAIDSWSKYLSEKCNIPIDKATELIKHHLG
jgi:hypothetical protein